MNNSATLITTVFPTVTDRLKKLGFELMQEAQVAQDIYSCSLARGSSTIDMKCIAMGNKGIIHMMRDGELKSLEFDLDALLKNDEVDAEKMNSLLAKVETLSSKLPASSTFAQTQSGIGSRSQFGIGERDLDPLAAAPGMIPPYGPGGYGGMIMDPSHPLFTQPPDFYRPRPMGFPPGSIPPGVRFDPITPLGPRYPIGSRPPGRSGFPVRPGPWSGEPDQDEFLPPGHPDDMYM